MALAGLIGLNVPRDIFHLHNREHANAVVGLDALIGLNVPSARLGPAMFVNLLTGGPDILHFHNREETNAVVGVLVTQQFDRVLNKSL